MLNKSNSRSQYTVQSKVTQYPVGFKFFFDGNNTPQVLVKIGEEIATLNVHYKFSEDLSALILIPLEEEKPSDPNDYSWMNKWVGKQLVIERDIPFVNESDYQVGRIAPEQIEKDFDLSVMRDQMLQQQITDNDADLESLFDTVAEHREDIDHAQQSADDAMAHTVAVEKRVTQAEKNIASNDVDIENIFGHQEEQDGRLSNLENSKIDKDQGKINVGKVLTVGGDGIVVPKVSQGGSGMGAVAHDETLVGAGTDEYPLGVKNKVTITIVEH